MKKIILLLTLSLCFLSAYSQKGYLRGTITDAQAGESLTGATIVVPGTSTGIISDLDGFYNLPLEAGTYTIQVSFISYDTRIFREINIEAGKVKQMDISLSPASTEIDEIVVVGEMRKQTEAAVQLMQKNSAVVLDGISSQQISRLGDSDAAAALRRVTGISVQEGKYIYVRGLSDRYLRVTLNGAEIPGLDPNINTVQMDLFPSNIIENIMVEKTFSPDNPSFTAGLVNITTRDFPSSFSLQASASAGFNTQAHFNNNFPTFNAGRTEWLGFSGKNLDLPKEAQGIDVPVPTAETAAEIYRISSSFNKELSIKRTTADPDMHYSLSFGNQKTTGRNSSLGYITALSYKKESKAYQNGRFDEYTATTSSAVQAEEVLTEDYGSTDIIWSALLGLNYKFNSNNKLGLVLLRNQNGLKQARYFEGETYGSDTYHMEKHSLEYLERSISAFQLKGEHLFPRLNNAEISWISSYTRSAQNSPDFRFFINEVVYNDQDTLYFVRSNRKPERRYRDMWETNLNSRIDFTFPLKIDRNNARLKTGFYHLEKFRNSDENRFTVNTLSSIDYDGNPDNYTRAENLLQTGNFSGGVYYDNDFFTNAYYSYTARDVINSAYMSLEFSLAERLKLVGGIRVESISSNIENKVDTSVFTRSSQKKQYVNYQPERLTDPLPSLNLNYKLQSNMNLRLAYSQSVIRPSFRERAPFVYYEFTTGWNVEGNPELKRGTVANYDLRWEYFFRPGEMISAGLFYKDIQDPIELYKTQTNLKLLRYRNGYDSFLYGFEVELRKNLDFIPVLEGFSIGANLSIIRSESPVDSLRLEQARENVPDFPDTRSLYGQSPYLINAFINYRNQKAGLDLNVAFNMEGPKIVIINKRQTPDLYEQSFAHLNFNFSKNLGEKFRLKFSARNLLNPEFEQTILMQDGEEYSARKYTLGRSFSLGIDYRFN